MNKKLERAYKRMLRIGKPQTFYYFDEGELKWIPVHPVKRKKTPKLK